MSALMLELSTLLAAALAFCVGVALQRGSICAVVAVRDVVDERRWARFLALLESAAWALLGLLCADALGIMPISAWKWSNSLPAAIAGGILFGVGALTNGACAFGSINRLASGETSFLALIAGIVAGSVAANRVGLNGAMLAPAPLAMSGWILAALIAVLAAFVLWRIIGAWKSTPTLERAIAKLAAPDWPPALAMFAVSFANLGLVLLVANWPYTTLLVDLALGRDENNALRIVLALVLLAGGIIGAATAGRFKWRGASTKELLKRASAGAIMGFGAVMIPGGNDALVLLGLPLLQPTAFAAYAAMVATIAFGFIARRAMRAR